MKRLVLLLVFAAACCLPLPAAAVESPCQAETGYFLSLRQKGQLVWWGRIRDAQGRWFDVWLCPGYVPPAKHMWKGLRWTGHNLAEYADGAKYRSLGRGSRSCYRWAFRDCFWRFTVKGVPRAWREDFREAHARTKRRVFGWWLAYPWATFTATVNTVVRVPVGLVGTTAGVAAGTVVVPGYHLVNSSVKAVWHLGVDTVAIPAAGFGWNTIIAPPMALVGQKPSPERADGFWVRVVTPAEIRRAELDGAPAPARDVARVAEWSRLLWAETKSFRERREQSEAETRRAVDAAWQAGREQRQAIDTEERVYMGALAADPKHQELAESARRACPDVERLDEISEHVLAALRASGMSAWDAHMALLLLRASAGGAPAPAVQRVKTDPLRQSVSEIKDIADHPYPPEPAATNAP